MTSDAGLESGLGPCRPERRLDVMVSPFAEECGMGPEILSRLFTIVHARNRHSADRVALAFPDITKDRAGGRVSIFGSAHAIAEMEDRMGSAAPHGALIITPARDASGEVCRAFFRNRAPERRTAAFWERQRRRDERRGKITPERDSPKPPLYGPHVMIRDERGSGIRSVNLSVSEPRTGSADEVVRVNTYGLSVRSSPAHLPA